MIVQLHSLTSRRSVQATTYQVICHFNTWDGTLSAAFVAGHFLALHAVDCIVLNSGLEWFGNKNIVICWQLSSYVGESNKRHQVWCMCICGWLNSMSSQRLAYFEHCKGDDL